MSAGEGLHLLKVAAYQCRSDVGSAMWLLFVVILLIYSIPNNKAWHCVLSRAGLSALVATSWYGNRVARAFYDPFTPVNTRYRLI